MGGLERNDDRRAWVTYRNGPAGEEELPGVVRRPADVTLGFQLV